MLHVVTDAMAGWHRLALLGMPQHQARLAASPMLTTLLLSQSYPNTLTDLTPLELRPHTSVDCALDLTSTGSMKGGRLSWCISRADSTVSLRWKASYSGCAKGVVLFWACRFPGVHQPRKSASEVLDVGKREVCGAGAGDGAPSIGWVTRHRDGDGGREVQGAARRGRLHGAMAKLALGLSTWLGVSWVELWPLPRRALKGVAGVQPHTTHPVSIRPH